MMLNTLINFVLDFENEENVYNLLWFLESDIINTLEDGPHEGFPLDGMYSYVSDTVQLLRHIEERLSNSCECHSGQVHFDVIDTGQAFLLRGALGFLAEVCEGEGEYYQAGIYCRLSEQVDTMMIEVEDNGRNA